MVNRLRELSAISARPTTTDNGLGLIRSGLVPPAVAMIPGGDDYQNAPALLNRSVWTAGPNMIYRPITPPKLGKESIKVYRCGLLTWM